MPSLEVIAETLTKVNLLAMKYNCKVRIKNETIYFDGEIEDELALVEELEAQGLI